MGVGMGNMARLGRAPSTQKGGFGFYILPVQPPFPLVFISAYKFHIQTDIIPNRHSISRRPPFPPVYSAIILGAGNHRRKLRLSLFKLIVCSCILWPQNPQWPPPWWPPWWAGAWWTGAWWTCGWLAAGCVECCPAMLLGGPTCPATLVLRRRLSSEELEFPIVLPRPSKG